MNVFENNPALKLSCFVGSAIQAGASIIGGVLDNIWQRNENDINRQAQQRENIINRQWTEDMFNKYESPVAQAQMMNSIGLNPQGNVNSQSVGSASTGSIPAGQAPRIGEALSQAGAAIGNYITNRPALEGVKLDNETRKLENRKRLQELYKQAMEIEDYEAVRSYRIEMEKEAPEYQRASTKEKKKMIEKIDEEIRALKQKSTDEHNESVARQSLISLQQEYQKIINDNADAKEKAQIQAQIASASASYASAMASNAQAEYTSRLEQNATEEEARRAAMHTIELEIQGYLRDVNASAAEIAKVDEYMKKLWSGKKNNYTFSDVGNMVLSFIKENLSIMGVGSNSRTQAVIPVSSRNPIGFNQN